MIDAVPDQAVALAAFRAQVLAAPDLQARLAALFVPEDFVAAASAAACALGFELDRAVFADAIAPDPLGLRRFQHCAMTRDDWPPNAWLPARSVPTGGVPAFDWIWFGPVSFDQSFFENSARGAAVQPFGEMFRIRTSLNAVIAGAAQEETVPLAGLIFHMSRCGSTLAAQMLAAVPDHIVLSEPEPVDAVVQWAVTSGAPLTEQVAALRAVVAAMGRNRTGTQRRLFLKTDCWHTLHLPLFRAAFPDVPWVFLHRDPIEVMVSQAREPGVHVVPGMLPPGVVAPTGDFVSLENYGARILAQICTAVPAHWHLGGGMVVDYEHVPDAMLEAIPAHFGFVPDAVERAAMTEARGRNAKAPAYAFAADSAGKQAAATPAIAAAVAQHLAAPRTALRRLEGIYDIIGRV